MLSQLTGRQKRRLNRENGCWVWDWKCESQKRKLKRKKKQM